LLILAQAAIGEGLPSAALEGLLQAQTLCEGTDQKAILPEVYRMLGQAYLALEELDRAEMFAQKGREVVEEDDTYSQGTTWFALSLVLAAQERHEEAEAAFGHAFEDLEASGEAYEIGQAHLEYGEYHLKQGDVEVARTHLEQAHESFVDLETKDMLTRIEELQAQLPEPAFSVEEQG
jgi:tetratricopeptide (TPR) repeat protein